MGSAGRPVRPRPEQRSRAPAIGRRRTGCDRITGVSSGNVGQFGAADARSHRRRKPCSITTSRPGSAANHELKAGMQFERGEHRAPTVIPGGVRYVDSNGPPFQAVYRAAVDRRRPRSTRRRSSPATRSRSSDRVTVNAGVRFDHSRAIEPGPPRDRRERPGNRRDIAGLGTLYTWNVVSPRLGVTAKLTRGRPDDAAGELRPVQPGRADRRTRARSIPA